MFYRLIASGLFAGAITGFIVALLQFYFVQPILALGEFYEQATFVLSQGLQSSIPDVRIQGFKPIEHIDIVRDGLSIVFNLFIYMGYGLILVSIIAFNEYKAIALKNARSGLIWGMAVFIALYLAPGFLMPPQVPGIQSIDVEIRQFYWFSIVISTSIALWLLAFGVSLKAFVIAIILLILPYLLTAPEVAYFNHRVPSEIGPLFVTRSYGINLIGSVLLGVLTCHFWLKQKKPS